MTITPETLAANRATLDWVDPIVASQQRAPPLVMAPTLPTARLTGCRAR